MGSEVVDYSVPLLNRASHRLKPHTARLEALRAGSQQKVAPLAIRRAAPLSDCGL